MSVLARLPAGWRWRMAHVARRAVERLAARCILLVEATPALHRLPRALLVPVERALIRAWAAFDGADYLERNPDVRDEGLDPLWHYLRHGWAEARTGGGPLRAMDDPPLGPLSPLARHLARRVRGTAPPEEEPDPPPDMAPVGVLLDRLARVRPSAVREPVVDVLVPVYRGRVETLNCLLHVLEASNRTPSRLVVIDDRGPDEPLRADLRRLARLGLCDLVVQPRNLGFVAAINAGMALHPGRDVIWLNADTEVYGDWIDRLLAVAREDPAIATVTPLTNNGTIASYPVFDRDNPRPLEIAWPEIDRLAARANGTAAVEAPTCVGFCTLVRRAAIDAAGPLDERAFGRGYGEENDFSRRVAALGWKNVIAGGVYVRHLGATSFGAERSARVDAAMRTVARRHPDYPALVSSFVRRDPVGPFRRRLDIARLAAAAPRPSVLIMTHGRGGGTARHVAEETARLRQSGVDVVVATGGDGGTIALSAPGAGPLPTLRDLTFGPEAERVLRAVGVAEIHVHHVIEFGADAPDRVVALAAVLGVPLEVTVHDYFALCPRINLAPPSGHYCGEPDAAGCGRCLASFGSEAGAPGIAVWRACHGRLLRAARRIRAPDGDVAQRLRRYFPDLGPIAVVAHEATPPAHARPPRRRGPPRIAVVGAIGPVKGFDVVLRLAREVRRRGAGAELVVIGHTRDDAAARAVGVRVTGRYADADVQCQIAVVDPDVILIPSTWPETFCYTLTHALASGRPVAAFDLGAQGRRLAEVMPEGVLPLSMARDPGRLLDRLLALSGQAAAVAGSRPVESLGPGARPARDRPAPLRFPDATRQGRRRATALSCREPACPD